MAFPEITARKWSELGWSVRVPDRPATDRVLFVRYADGTSKRYEFDSDGARFYVYTAVGNRRGEITHYLPIRSYRRRGKGAGK